MKRDKKARRGFYKRIDSLPEIYKYILLVFFIAVIVFNLYLIFFSGSKSTGFGTSATGQISFGILGNPEINITHPLNETYNFSIGDSYILDLNVTSSEVMDSWIYNLYDLRHNVWTYQGFAFSPNTTFTAARWGNQLFVDAFIGEKRFTDNVTFFVYVPNSAPIINGLNQTAYICEGKEFLYNFNATDADEDLLQGSMTSNSNNYFFLFPIGVNYNRNLWGNTSFFSINSALLPKEAAGGINNGFLLYPLNVSVVDGNRSDTKIINITVIEINNPPMINPPLGLTTKTIWNRGENSTLFQWVNVSDVEYDLFGHGVHRFNLTIINSSGSRIDLFNLTRFGENAFINFTATNQSAAGVYNVTLCVNDTGISNPYLDIQKFCGQSGGSITTCDNFWLTITNQNRAPTIINRTPYELNLNVSATNKLDFGIIKYDPDGTIPDAYWYVDNKLIEFHEGNLINSDNFSYTFPCGFSGERKLKVDITDGELNDSLTWNLSVSFVECFNPSGGGGGGGGGGGLSCVPSWGCTAWNICQNAKSSLEQGILSGLGYRLIDANCSLKQLTEDRCGFQIRKCSDLKNCSSNSGKPEEVIDCLYTENPSCKDGVKNCHEGDCELLVDCGGPCPSCPSCSDKIKNQGEQGIDCGGPCPWKCIPETPLLKRTNVIYGFLILLIIIIALIIIKLIRVLRYKRMIERSKKPNI